MKRLPLLVIAFALLLSSPYAGFRKGEPSAEELTRTAPTFVHPVGSSDRKPEEDAIRETVFLHQFEHNGSTLQSSAKCFFLAFESDTDPEDGFINRFSRHNPPVKKLSEAVVSEAGVVDRNSGGKGLIFFISAVTWINENEVQVRGGYYEGGLSSSMSTFRLQRKDGGWVITGSEASWTS